MVLVHPYSPQMQTKVSILFLYQALIASLQIVFSVPHLDNLPFLKLIVSVHSVHLEIQHWVLLKGKHISKVTIFYG